MGSAVASTFLCKRLQNKGLFERFLAGPGRRQKGCGCELGLLRGHRHNPFGCFSQPAHPASTYTVVPPMVCDWKFAATHCAIWAGASDPLFACMVPPAMK